MIAVEVTDDGLVIRVPRRDVLAFGALVEDAQRKRGLSPADTDFRQRVAAAVVEATAELARRGPRRGA